MHLTNARKRLLRFYESECGSATIESMLVFPLVMLVILILLLVAVYGYQAVYVQYVSLTAADRASYNWDARERSIRHGDAQSSHYYGLYEHELSIILLKNWITVSDNIKSHELSIEPNRTLNSEGSLVYDRLAQAHNYIASTNNNFEGRLTLKRQGFMPVVTVQLKKQISPLLWQQQQLLPSPAYSTKHELYAPTQFIRNVDLFLNYFNRFSSLDHEQQLARKNKGGKALKSFSS